MTQPKSLRILLVEDDGGIAHVIRVGLHTLGSTHQLDHALTAEEGFDLWRQHSYDLVLSDYNLRGKNGLELVAQIRELTSVVPIVLITAYDTPAIRRQATKTGVTRFVAKPFFVDEFTDLVRSLLPTQASQMGA